MLDDIRRLLVRELESFVREIELFPDEASVWRTVPGATNSAGTLSRHACGNLRHFVGAVLGQDGYVRDRDAEFGPGTPTRAELVAELRRTIEVVNAVLPGLDPAVLDRAFPQPVGGVSLPGRLFLLHLEAHLAFHLGQASYLRRIVTGEGRSSGPIPIAALAD
jgi:hypothetical protein